MAIMTEAVIREFNGDDPFGIGRPCRVEREMHRASSRWTFHVEGLPPFVVTDDFLGLIGKVAPRSDHESCRDWHERMLHAAVRQALEEAERWVANG